MTTKHIPGEEDVVRAIGRWRASDLAYIETLVFRGEGSLLDLTALYQRREDGPWPDIDRPFCRVVLSFSGIRDMTLKDFGGRVQVMGFSLRDMSTRGWDRVCWEISDYEEGRIRFLSQTVELSVDAEFIRI